MISLSRSLGGGTNYETIRYRKHKLSTNVWYNARPPHPSWGAVEMDLFIVTFKYTQISHFPQFFCTFYSLLRLSQNFNFDLIHQSWTDQQQENRLSLFANVQLHTIQPLKLMKKNARIPTPFYHYCNFLSRNHTWVICKFSKKFIKSSENCSKFWYRKSLKLIFSVGKLIL